MKLWVGYPAVLLLAASLSFAAIADQKPADGAFALQRVVAALQAANVPLQSAQVHLLAVPVLKNPFAALAVTGITPRDAQSAVVRMQCRKGNGDCLPFYVLLHWGRPMEREAAFAELNSPARITTVSRVPDKPLVRAGQRATLLIENNQMRVATPIICLQSGSRGQKIRVTSLDRKRIAFAEVVEPGIVKGSL
jgi:Chaperone for flagella basal body P-ring formation